jgi:AraC-like DNA-binding protein
MGTDAFLSPKMPQVTGNGFLLCQNQQQDYDSRWHLHDCAMLLWPQGGDLHVQWLPDAHLPANLVSARLRRGMATLLPSHAHHRTRAETHRQQHGTLYLAREQLGTFSPPGMIQLDGSVVAMLDALTSAALRADAAAPLVRAIVAQCMAAPRIPATWTRESLVQQMLQCIARALDREEGPPSIERIARSLGVSPRTLERHCEAEAVASPVALRRHLLAAHARALLRQGQTLSQVSRRLDFANSGHLSRLLKHVPE